MSSCDTFTQYPSLTFKSILTNSIGNKTDRDDREIPTAIGEEFAKQQGMYFLETSAKEADNVERLFYEIAAELIEQARTKEVILMISIVMRMVFHFHFFFVGIGAAQ